MVHIIYQAFLAAYQEASWGGILVKPRMAGRYRVKLNTTQNQVTVSTRVADGLALEGERSEQEKIGSGLLLFRAFWSFWR